MLQIRIILAKQTHNQLIILN